MRATGYASGRPGHVVDHIVPLAWGGPDIPSNMQWQTAAEAKAKDRIERWSAVAVREPSIGGGHVRDGRIAGPHECVGLAQGSEEGIDAFRFGRCDAAAIGL